MTEGVFLASLEELCNGLRAALAREYQNSVASLQANLERLTAENSELRTKFCNGGTKDVDAVRSSSLTQAERKLPAVREQASDKQGMNKGDQEQQLLQTVPAMLIGDREDNAEEGEDDNEENQEGDQSLAADSETMLPEMRAPPQRASVRFQESPILSKRPSLKPALKRVSVVNQATVPAQSSSESALNGDTDGKNGNASWSILESFMPPGIAEAHEEEGEDDASKSDREASFISEGEESDDEETYDVADCWEVGPSRGWGSVVSRTSRKSGFAEAANVLADVQFRAHTFHEDGEDLKTSWLEDFNTFLEDRVVLMPYSRTHVFWEIIGCCLLLYDLTVVPLEVFEPEETDFTVTTTWMVRIFWTLDICISFLTGYIDNEGITIMSLHKIAKHYISAQFPVDVIVVLCDWLDAIIGVRATGVMKGGRILRIMRLVRVKKARQLWYQLAEYVNADRMLVIIRTCKNLLLFLFSLHFLACLWWATGLLEVDSGSSWITDLTDLTLEEKYLRSFHKSVANFYGQLYNEPFNQLERLYSLILLCFSFMFQIWMVSSVTTAMTHLEIVSSHRTNMFSALDRFLTLHQVSRELRLKVHRSASHSLQTNERHVSEESVELLKLISDPLVVRLHVEMYAPVLSVCPFLRCLMFSNAVTTRRLCHAAISVDHVVKDDIIFSELEVPLEPKVRFVLNGGRLQYTSSKASMLEATEMNWLSEAVLWTDDWIHKGTARATTDTQILCLSAASFRSIVTNAFDGEGARQYARVFVNTLIEGENLSDMSSYDLTLKQMIQSVFPFVWEKVSHEFQVGEPGAGGEDRRSAFDYLRHSLRRSDVRSSVRRSDLRGSLAWNSSIKAQVDPAQSSPNSSTSPDMNAAQNGVVPAATQASTSRVSQVLTSSISKPTHISQPPTPSISEPAGKASKEAWA